MTRISTGTVSVANGTTLVAGWVGDDAVVLSEITAPADSQVVIEGFANFQDQADHRQLRAAAAHEGLGGDDRQGDGDRHAQPHGCHGRAARRARRELPGHIFKIIPPSGNVNPGLGNAPAPSREAISEQLESELTRKNPAVCIGGV
jgi:hypothetical protein